MGAKRPENRLPHDDGSSQKGYLTMSRLYKRKYLAADPVTGEKTERLTPKWYGQFVDGDGVPRRVPLSTNKTAAQQMLNELVRRAELAKVGIRDDYAEHRQRPLADHVADFRQHLESKDRSSKHVAKLVSYVEKVFDACGCHRLNDLNAGKARVHLASRRQEGMSVAGSNDYVAALKNFGNWLVQDRRLPENPFRFLARQNAAVDVRHQRRELSPDELARLIRAAESGKMFRALTGNARALLYRTAAFTGLRASELNSLTESSFNFTAVPPTVTVAACYSKRRREDVLPLHDELVTKLKGWFRERLEQQPKPKTLKMATVKKVADNAK